MLDIYRFMTEENRAAMRRLLEKYTDMAEGAKDMPDEDVDPIIQILTSDALKPDMDENYAEACLKILSDDMENEAAYDGLLYCLRFVKLVYFEKKDPQGRGTLYPMLQADASDDAERAFPVYTRKRQALNPEFKTFRSHHADFGEIAELASGGGCDDIVINADTDCFLFSAESTLAYINACEETSGMFHAIFTDGIEGEDLCPLVCACMDSKCVICTLKDGTEVSGVLVLPRTEEGDEAVPVPEADSFTIMMDTEAEDGDKVPGDVIVLKADVSTISLAPDDASEDEDPEDGEELN